MEPISLKAFMGNPFTRNLAEVAFKLSEEMDIVPIVSFYLEDELLKNLIKNLEQYLKDVYKYFSKDRNLFLENAIKKIDINAKKMNEFPYYALPEDEVELTFVENNLVPPKVVIKEGKVRLTFVPYESYGELRRAVSSQGEDDLVATFKNGKLIHLEKKRNIFIENKSVDALSEGEVTLNFYPTKFVLFSSVLAMNVRLWENVVKVSTQGEDVIMRVESGKASKQEVIEGNTLSARSKAALFYDYKRKLIFGKEIIDSLASKLL